MKVYIDHENTGDFMWDKRDTWKEYCGADNFDESYVLTGNQYYNEHAEASWYTAVMYLIDDLYDEAKHENFPRFTDEQWLKIMEIYNGKGCLDDDANVLRLLKILYPNDEFKITEIHGYRQGDWQKVFYKANTPHNIDLLEAIYFGKISRIYAEDEDGTTISDIVTHDELWKAQDNGTLKQLVRDHLGIPEDEDVTIYESDGHVQTLKWKQVG